LLIHARTKLYIHSDGSARYISNENEKVEIYLLEAIQLFKESNRHDNGYLSFPSSSSIDGLCLGLYETTFISRCNPKFCKICFILFLFVESLCEEIRMLITLNIFSMPKITFRKFNSFSNLE
jgi:hypothetical protein